MNIPTPTRSKDGKPRCNVAIRFRVGTEYLELAAADWLMSDDGLAFAELSRSVLWQRLRHLLYNRGDSSWMTIGDNVHDWCRNRGVDPDDVWAGARAAVRRLFPELVSGG